MNRNLFVAVSLLFSLCAVPALAAEDYLGAVSSTTSTPATYVATAAASLSLQCDRPVRYAAGTSGAPPTASSTSIRLPFLDGKSQPIQLVGTQDRISIYSSTGFYCEVYTLTGAAASVSVSGSIGVLGADGGAVAVTINGFNTPQGPDGGAQNFQAPCVTVVETVTSVGVTATPVPASAQTARKIVLICNSTENAGVPKVKCRADGTNPIIGSGTAGQTLGVGDCILYSTHAVVNCISDTAATAVSSSECK